MEVGYEDSRFADAAENQVCLALLDDIPATPNQI